MIFIRHGFVRERQSRGRLDDVLHHRYYLILRWRLGIRIRKMRKVASKLDVEWCAKRTNRAIETALLMFPRYPVFVVPHVKDRESGGLDND